MTTLDDIFAALQDDLDSAPVKADGGEVLRADGALTDAGEALRFVLGGNAHFTLVSKATGARFTYRVRKAPDDGRGFEPCSFVSLLSGPDNENSYSYFGYIRRGVFFHGRGKAKVAEGAASVRGFAWAFRALSQGALPASLEVWHEGRCARCARRLTVPSSIASGFGPECEGKAMAEAA